MDNMREFRKLGSSLQKTLEVCLRIQVHVISTSAVGEK